jgi:hypothetical protein
MYSGGLWECVQFALGGGRSGLSEILPTLDEVGDSVIAMSTGDSVFARGFPEPSHNDLNSLIRRGHEEH